MYLNPTDALHGDLGIVRKEDLVVLFSKSGSTEELVRLVPYAKVQTRRFKETFCGLQCSLLKHISRNAQSAYKAAYCLGQAEILSHLMIIVVPGCKMLAHALLINT